MSVQKCAEAAAHMKRMGKFTRAELADAMKSTNRNASFWLDAFYGAGLLRPQGFGHRRGKVGPQPILWEWQG